MKNEENKFEEETDVSATEPEAVSAETPKKKRRWLKRILILLGALIAVILLVVAFLLGPIVEFGVNKFGASVLGVDKCSIASAKIYPFAGYVRFEKIEIGKPLSPDATFSHDLFSLELLDADVDVFSLLSQKKIIEHFELRNLSANYEQLLSGATNVGVLLNNVLGEPNAEESEKEASEKKDVAETDDEEPEEIFVGARYFVIENVRVAAYIRGVPVVFPAMSADFADGLGIDEDLTPVEFGMKVAGNFMSVIDFFRKSALGDATRAAVGVVSDAAVMTGDAAKAAADLATGAVSGAASATADVVSDAATLTGDAISGAATLTGDAAKASVDAVSDAAGAVLDLFKSKDPDNEK